MRPEEEARAIGLALALLYFSEPTQFKYVFELSDKFSEYIIWGRWPKEALAQIGKVNEVEEGRIARVRAEVQG